ncbi:MAG: cysteine desulfurase family protein [Thermoleophilia bacterium]
MQEETDLRQLHPLPIYLDNNATTPLHPEVSEAMKPFLGRVFGNPSSGHVYGVEARSAVTEARAAVARLLGCSSSEIVFTGGGSEADNLALRGVAGEWSRHRGRPGRLLISAVEHPAVTASAEALAEEGWTIDVVGVDGEGRVDPAEVESLLRDDTALVSIMHANNETGSVNPIGEIARLARTRGILVHTDAAQSVGKLPTRVDDLGVDLLTVAAHKLHGPKGIGALYVRNGVDLRPVIPGGGQEGGRRAGTENLIGIAGLGAAADLAEREGLMAFSGRVQDLRDRLHELLLEEIPDLVLNGPPVERLPNTLNVSVPGLRGPDLLDATPEVAASTGSACHEGEDRPSAVLTAMAKPPEIAMGALRLTLGLLSDTDDVERAARALGEGVRRLRKQ